MATKTVRPTAKKMVVKTQKVQTAEGWNRMMRTKLTEAKKKK